MSTLRFANGFSTTGDSFLHLLLVLYFAYAQLLLTPKVLPILRTARCGTTRHMSTTCC